MAKMRFATQLLLLLAISVSVTVQDNFQECVGKLDIIYVVDGSNSMGRNNFNSQIDSVKSLIASMAVNDAEVHAGIVVFSSGVSTDIPLTGDQDYLLGLDISYPDDMTRTDLGIEAARENFANHGRNGDVPKLMMIITDGQSDNTALTEQQADLAKNTNGIDIYAVGVTQSVDLDELQKIASSPENVYTTNDFTELEDTLNAAIKQACVDVDPTYPATTTTTPTTTTSTTTTTTSTTTTSTTTTTTPPPPSLECSDAPIDLAFVLDSSVDDATFASFKDFVTTFVAFADIDDGYVKVALATYSDATRVWGGLNEHNTKASLYQAISDIQRIPGNSNPSSALVALREQIFVTANGDRHAAPDATIYLTGSAANVDATKVATEAQTTRSEGIEIYAVGVGAVTAIDVRAIASLPQDEHVYVVPDTSGLTDVMGEIFISFNKFCQDPQPVPACAMGRRDVYLMVDVSSTADRLSAQNTYGDFGHLKTGLHGLTDIILDPSVPNPDLHLGLVIYSDSANALVNVGTANSASATAAYIDILPAGMAQGGARLDLGLQAINSPAVQSEHDSFVLIVTPQNVPNALSASVTAEAERLQNLGYTIAIAAVTDKGSWSVSSFPLQTANGLTYPMEQYKDDLMATMRAFTRDWLCLNSDRSADGDPTSLCTNSGHVKNGVSTIAHPEACDKFVQCYYNPTGQLDIAVVRHCPMGRFFNNATKTCVKPAQSDCPYDKCRFECEPYKMEGSCRAYWACVDGVSVPKCCNQSYAYIPGMGCMLDFSCTDYCGPDPNCPPNGFCNKRPDWTEPAAYEVSMASLQMWMPRPCIYKDFDIVDCDCSVQRDYVCPADHTYDLTDAATYQVTPQEGTHCHVLTMSGVTRTATGAEFTTGSHLNVPMEPMYAGDDFTIKMRYAESANYNRYATVILNSGHDCEQGGSTLMILAGEGYMEAELHSNVNGNINMAKARVPTMGIPRDSFKDLLFTYHNKTMSLSVKGQNQQYIERVAAPASVSLRCGIDIGGTDKYGFHGTVEYISVSSCTPAKLY